MTASAGAGAGPAGLGLRRFLQPEPARPAAGEVCEFCGEPLGPEHSHVVDMTSRALQCTCRPCWMLFVPKGAAGGRRRAVPERYRYEPAFTLTAAQWNALQIPVQMAFFFTNSASGELCAFYPSPAGATESLLSLDAWAEIMAANPALAGAEPDVEAVILHRARGADETEAFLAPIDRCYELVGLVRAHWKGFDGGQEAWAAIADFFADLRQRCGVPAGRQQ